jgi:alkylation response protein AidB-like acyl-CoA dehydrogenase
MNFDWKPEESELRKRVAGLFDGPARLEVEAMEEADLPALKAITGRFLNRLAETGYLSPGLGPEAAAEALTLAAAQEELANISGSLFLAVEVTARLFGGLLAGYGSPKLKTDILEPLKSGQVIGAVAMAEPGGPEPQPGWVTSGRKQGDKYVVNGRKSFVTNGPLADWLAVAGLVEGRPAFFLMKPGQEGLTIGPRLKTLGYNGLAAGALEMSGVEVAEDLVLGPFDHEEPWDFARLVQDMVLALASVGVISRTLNAANDHARTYHRGAKPIYAHQEVRFKLADMFTLYQTSQLLCYRAAWFIASGDKEAGVLVGCAKVFCAEAAEKIAGLALQIMAGQGYVSGNTVERGYRDAKYAALAGTTSEISRMNIADDILRRNAV